jgi:hypothetical protein
MIARIISSPVKADNGPNVDCSSLLRQTTRTAP